METSSNSKLFRVRQIMESVEGKPASKNYSASLKFNPLPSKSYYYWLLAPAILLLAAISLYPFFWMIYMSLNDVEVGSIKWNNFANYTKLLTDAKFWNGWKLFLYYSALCLFLQITLGVFLALVLNNSRYEKVLVTVLLMPMMMAPVVAGMVWYFLYNGTFGWYHWIFESLGILGEKSILADIRTAMWGIVLVDVWQWTPLITLITLAGLKRVPQDQLEEIGRAHV